MILHRFETGRYEGKQMFQHVCVPVRRHRYVVQRVKTRQQEDLRFIISTKSVDVLFESRLPPFVIETFGEVARPELIPDEVVALLDTHDGLYRMDQHTLYEPEIRPLLNRQTDAFVVWVACRFLNGSFDLFLGAFEGAGGQRLWEDGYIIELFLALDEKAAFARVVQWVAGSSFLLSLPLVEVGVVVDLAFGQDAAGGP